MNSGKYIFSQLVEFLPQKEFYMSCEIFSKDSVRIANN